MRTITGHEINACNAGLTITSDEPGEGGAPHYYGITVAPAGRPDYRFDIEFQCGPVREVGTNGITHEALLAIILDRLQCFQAGDYRCRENALAITKIEEALHWLHHRTRLREDRGVEGTSQV